MQNIYLKYIWELYNVWIFQQVMYLGSWLCQIHWSHVGWWNSSNGDSWTGAGTELDSDMHNSEIKVNSCNTYREWLWQDYENTGGCETVITYSCCVQVITLRLVLSSHTSSMTISAALRTDSMTSPRALHTPTWPGVSPLSRAHGAAPDTGLERGSLARELGQESWHWYGESQQVWGAKQEDA